jgi:hypothetical protein
MAIFVFIIESIEVSGTVAIKMGKRKADDA